jgi:hypothetical protein
MLKNKYYKLYTLMLVIDRKLKVIVLNRKLVMSIWSIQKALLRLLDIISMAVKKETLQGSDQQVVKLER